MQTRSAILIISTLLLARVCLPVRAQLVADGATATINAASTNIAGLTVGTNGSFTTLVITNGGKVTNSPPTPRSREMAPSPVRSPSPQSVGST